MQLLSAHSRLEVSCPVSVALGISYTHDDRGEAAHLAGNGSRQCCLISSHLPCVYFVSCCFSCIRLCGLSLPYDCDLKLNISDLASCETSPP